MKLAYPVRYLGGVVLALSLLTLGACRTTPKEVEPAGNDNYAGHAETSAETYGASDTEESEARVNEYGETINSLKAPSNQTYYFDFDSNVVRQSDYQAMGIQAKYLASHPNAKIRLEGNTDARGSREYNIGLGWRRDQAVARILEQQGVLPNQIDMVSYGKERPAVIGDDERAYHLNRRVNLVYEEQR